MWVYDIENDKELFLIGLDGINGSGGGVNKKKIIIKSDTIPQASEKTFKLIYIYSGKTNNTYHHGYIYECVGDSSYDPIIGFYPTKIGFDYTKGNLTTFFQDLITETGATCTLSDIVQGKMIFIGGDTWKIEANDSEGNLLFEYQQYQQDFEDAGFVWLNPPQDYQVGEEIPYEIDMHETISNYHWEQLDVQPNGSSGDLSIYQLKMNMTQDPNSTSQGTYPSSYALSQAQKGNVKSVNFKTPDDSGNVLITQVATAENLVSPDNINDYGTFIFRTSAGTKSIAANPTTHLSEATLLSIQGEILNPRRSPDNIDKQYNAAQRVFASVDATTFGIAVNHVSGEAYTFNFDGTNWTLQGETPTMINLEDYGISLTGTSINGDSCIVNYTYDDSGEEPVEYANITYNEVTRIGVLVNETIFASKVNNVVGSYNFVYSGDRWFINDISFTTSDLNTQYGITIIEAGTESDPVIATPVSGDSLTVTYNGDMKVATPTSFVTSSFNQFNPANVLSDCTINENGEIVTSTGSSVAYIHGVGGLQNAHGSRHGDYTIYDENGTLIRIGYSKTVPTVGDTVETDEVVKPSDDDPSQVAQDAYTQWISFNQDGYICIALTNTAKLCVHPEWSGYMDAIWQAYAGPVTWDANDGTKPSIIPMPDKGVIFDDPNHSVENDLACENYLARIGNIYDEIRFEDHLYINRIGYLQYSTANLEIVEQKGVDYVYDSNGIYYVLEDPKTYIINYVEESGAPVIVDGKVKLNDKASGQYMVCDFGTEEFTGTEVAVLGNFLYGNNLVDKLRTDVLTKSAQSLSQEQKEQVWDNLGLQPIYNHVNTLAANATVTINLVPTKQVYELTPTSNTTLEFNTANLTEFNAQDSDVEIEFTLYIKMVDAQQAWEITFPDTVVWGNTSPTMTAMANYKFSFCKPKGSSVWIGNQMYSWVE